MAVQDPRRSDGNGVLLEDDLAAGATARGLGLYTSAAPAFTAFDGKLVMVYRGTESGGNLYVATSDDGIRWNRPVRLERHRCKEGPSIAAYKMKLLIAYISNDSYENVLVTVSTNGVDWSEEMLVGAKSGGGPARSRLGPAICAFNDDLAIAYVAKDKRGFYAMKTSSPYDWNASLNPVTGHSSNVAPAIAAFSGDLRLAYIAGDASRALMTASSADAKTWTTDVSHRGHQSTYRVAIDPAMGPLGLVYVDHGSGTLKLTESEDTVNWTPAEPIPGSRCRHGPAFSAFEGNLAVGYVDLDGQLHTTCRPEGSTQWKPGYLVGRSRDNGRPPAASTTIVRAQILHTPRDPFERDDALESYSDGGLAFADGRILEVGDFWRVRSRFPDAELVDAQDGVLLPGFVDTHVHYPQLAIIGTMGLPLLEWLAKRVMPEEARFADVKYARLQADAFVRLLAANGTTAALVHGAHFPAAQNALFEAAAWSGLRITSGLVVANQHIPRELWITPEDAHDQGAALIDRWHGRGRLRYAVTPRFSLACSESLLESCRDLVRSRPDLMITSHINENKGEVEEVARTFPWARDYLETYDRFELTGDRTVFAHNVHGTDREIERLGERQARVAHCPTSNTMLASGIMRLKKHLECNVPVALATDVGGGSGLSMVKEAQRCYELQAVLPEEQRQPLTPARLLYLATSAGARSLHLDGEIGDLQPGKAADFVLMRPPAGSELEHVLSHSRSADMTLSAVLSLAREDAVAEVRVGGEIVHARSLVSEAALAAV